MSRALEERVADLMRAVEDLSDMVARQGREIDRLAARVALLVAREAEREAGTGDLPAGTERPPHW
jgi:SlyX protein